MATFTPGALECICGTTNDMRVWTVHEGVRGYEYLLLRAGQEAVRGSDPLLCMADGVGGTSGVIGRSSSKTDS